MGVLAGCGGSTSETVTLKLWTISLKPKFNDYLGSVIADFEKENAGVKVEWEDMPMDAITQKLLTSISSGDVPDVVNLNTEYATKLAAKGALTNLDTELQKADKEQYFESLYKATAYKGGVYGLPWYTGTSVMFVNKDLFKEAGIELTKDNYPKTQKELHEMYKTIHQKTGKYGAAMIAGATMMEGEIVSEDGTKATFNNDKNKAALKEYKALFDQGVVPKEAITSDREPQFFSGGQAAVYTAGPAAINKIKTANAEIMNSVDVFPSVIGSRGYRTASTMNLVVPAKTKNKELAIKLAQHVTNAKNQLEFSKQANILPSTKESIKDEFFKKDDGTIEAKAKMESVAGLSEAQDFVLNGEVRQAIQVEMENYLLNDKDLDAMLKDCEKTVNEILARINKE